MQQRVAQLKMNHYLLLPPISQQVVAKLQTPSLHPTWPATRISAKLFAPKPQNPRDLWLKLKMFKSTVYRTLTNSKRGMARKVKSIATPLHLESAPE